MAGNFDRLCHKLASRAFFSASPLKKDIGILVVSHQSVSRQSLPDLPVQPKPFG
jgi:hypothetical protein